MANSVDPDQMLHSDLGLHCLPYLSVPILMVIMVMLSMLSKNSADDKIFFLFFPENSFDTSCKLYEPASVAQLDGPSD